jgi:tRNA modification GTPase
VIEMIRSTTDLALRSATEQLQGRLGAAVKSIRDQLIKLLAHVEAAIDFPDEDLAPDEGERLRSRLEDIRAEIARLLATAEQGKIMREGVRVVIYGATNAGKSSLLNRLLGYDRAIVSEIPGTTRDTIEEVINVRGVPLRLLDTAGLRESFDPLERAGIERTERSLEAADLVLHVVDRSAPKPPDFAAHQNGRAHILLLNKSDLVEHADWAECDGLRISCVSENGLAGLDEKILSGIGAKNMQAESSIAINARHRDCLRRAAVACEAAAATLSNDLSPELAAVDLRNALAAVAEVIGSDSDDAILDSVFAQFCIGK